MAPTFCNSKNTRSFASLFSVLRLYLTMKNVKKPAKIQPVPKFCKKRWLGSTAVCSNCRKSFVLVCNGFPFTDTALCENTKHDLHSLECYKQAGTKCGLFQSYEWLTAMLVQANFQLTATADKLLLPMH